MTKWPLTCSFLSENWRKCAQYQAKTQKVWVLFQIFTDYALHNFQNLSMSRSQVGLSGLRSSLEVLYFDVFVPPLIPRIFLLHFSGAFFLHSMYLASRRSRYSFFTFWSSLFMLLQNSFTIVSISSFSCLLYCLNMHPFEMKISELVTLSVPGMGFRRGGGVGGDRIRGSEKVLALFSNHCTKNWIYSCLQVWQIYSKFKFASIANMVNAILVHVVKFEFAIYLPQL